MCEIEMDDVKEKPNDDEQEVQEPLLGSSSRPIKIIPMMKIESAPVTVIKSDDICSEVMGDWGWWQCRTVMIVFLTKIPAAWFMACIIFTAPEPWYNEYKCDLNYYQNQLNESTVKANLSHPTKITANGSYIYDYCNIDVEYKLNWNETVSSYKTIPCDKFIYEVDPYFSVVTQYDLLCSRSILVAITQVFHLLGVLIGGVIATHMMEKWSPKVVMMVGMILLQPCGIAAGYVPLYWLHSLFRCLAAACCAMTFTPGAAIMSDIIGGRKKTIVSGNFEQFWSIGIIILPAIGYYTVNWAQIYITITVPMVLVMFLWIWIPDSPRWHLNKQNLEKVKCILENSLSVNRRDKKSFPNMEDLIREQALTAQVSKEKLEPQDNWKHLISLPGALWCFILVATSFSLIITCYYGALLNIRSFGRHYLYINTAIAGLCELIGGFAGFQILMHMKAKWKAVGSLTMFCGLVTCFIWILPVHVDGSHMLNNLLLISMVNKIGISACLCVVTTCTAELFPAPHKKRAVFWSTVIARTIFMTAPLIGVTVKYGDGVSLTFFGMLTTVGGFCAFLVKPVKVKVSNLPRVLNSKIWNTNEDPHLQNTKF